MTNDEHDSSTETPPKQRTRIRTRSRRFVWTTLAAAILAVGLIYLRWRANQNLEWYVSPPIDSQGHRVHVLVPIGAKPYPDPKLAGWEDNGEPGEMMIKLASESTHRSMLWDWLDRLKLMPPEEPRCTVWVHAGVNASLAYEYFFGTPVTANGEIKRSLSWDPAWTDTQMTARFIRVKGTPLEAGILVTGSEPVPTPSSRSTAMCNSLHIE